MGSSFTSGSKSPASGSKPLLCRTHPLLQHPHTHVGVPGLGCRAQPLRFGSVWASLFGRNAFFFGPPEGPALRGHICSRRSGLRTRGRRSATGRARQAAAEAAPAFGPRLHLPACTGGLRAAGRVSRRASGSRACAPLRRARPGPSRAAPSSSRRSGGAARLGRAAVRCERESAGFGVGVRGRRRREGPWPRGRVGREPGAARSEGGGPRPPWTVSALWAASSAPSQGPLRPPRVPACSVAE